MGFWEKFGIAGNEIMKLIMPLITKFMKENGATILEIALKIIPIIAMTLAADSTTGADSGAQKRKAASIVSCWRQKNRGLPHLPLMLMLLLKLQLLHLKQRSVVKLV